MFRDFEESAGEPARGGSRDVPDPWYGDYSDFEATRATIEKCTPAILEYAAGSLNR